jgi:hypothetical protein
MRITDTHMENRVPTRRVLNDGSSDGAFIN